MKRISLILALVLLVGGVAGAVPYPYGVHEMETTGDLKEIHDAIVREHTMNVQAEDGSFYPWHELSNVKIETRMTIDARINRDADLQFWTPTEIEQNTQKLYADLLDDKITFLFMLFADSPGASAQKYLEMGTNTSGINRVVLEVDGEIYLPIGFEPLSVSDRMGLNYAYFPRYDGEKQIITTETKLARLWMISGTNRVFFDFSFDPYYGEIVETTPPVVIKPLHRWSGTGMKNTEMFEVSGSWRIRWNVSNELFTGSGLLQAFLNDSQGQMISLPINHLGEGSGETWIHNQSGKFYLEVLSSNCDWEIEIFSD